MHMADALVSPPVAAVMGAASVGAMAFSVYKVKKQSAAFDISGTPEENNNKKIPLMGVMGAFVFAAQMLNFTIPGTGSSGHICGGMLLAAMLGPYHAFLSMAVVLLLQCLIFADGGLMALGCNIWNMAFYACFAGYFLFYKPFVKNKFSRGRIMLGSVLACVFSLQMGAFSVVLETLASGITELPFAAFAGLMQPIHLVIGLVEGVLTGFVLIFVYEARPEFIHAVQSKNRLSFGKVVAVFAVLAVIFAGGVSLLASSNPDGLEWSIGKASGTEELEANGAAYDKAENMVDKTAVLSDYTVGGSEKPAGTSAAGIIGAALVAALCAAVCLLLNIIRKKRLVRNENG